MHRVIAAALAVSLTVGIGAGQVGKSPIKPGKIFVGSFGMGDDAEQLRLALGYELSRAGFKVVDFQAQADSTLTGLVVTRMEAGKSVKRVTVFLKDKSGKPLWNEDIGSTSTATRSAEDAIRERAEDVAKALKKDASPQQTPTKKPKA